MFFALFYVLMIYFMPLFTLYDVCAFAGCRYARTLHFALMPMPPAAALMRFLLMPIFDFSCQPCHAIFRYAAAADARCCLRLPHAAICYATRQPPCLHAFAAYAPERATPPLRAPATIQRAASALLLSPMISPPLQDDICAYAAHAAIQRGSAPQRSALRSMP